MWSTTKALAAGMAAATLLVAGAGSALAAIECDTIRMIVPWKAGGGTDRIGRGLAVALEKQSGKSVIVDNISGASSATARSTDSDGHSQWTAATEPTRANGSHRLSGRNG